MENKYRIIILTSDFGFGHRSAANSIAEALRLTAADLCTVEIINLLEDKRVLGVLRSNQADYDRIVRDSPEFQRLGYQFSDTAATNGIWEAFLSVVFFPVMAELLDQKKPDLVLTTFNMYVAPMNTVIGFRKSHVPFLTVITDLTKVHRSWMHPGSNLTFVPTQEVYREAQAIGIHESQLMLTGIPVRPELSLRINSVQDIRHKLGWHPEITTALVVGSKRVKNLEKTLHALNHTGWPLQWILVAGKDEKLYKWFREQEWHNPISIYPYVDNLAPFLQAADFVISKAGGLIVSESLACGLPLLLVDVTPGQEEGNAEYVIAKQAGEYAPNPLSALEVLSHWMKNDQEVMKDRAGAAKKLGRPTAAFDIAARLIEILEQGPQTNLPAQRIIQPRIQQLLEGLGINRELEESGKINKE